MRLDKIHYSYKLLFFAFLDKAQRSRINAKPLAGFGRPVGKNVSEMSAAFRAGDFNALHATTHVVVIHDRSGKRVVETRPSGSRVKLGFRREKLRTTTSALVHPFFFIVQELSAERRFRSFFSEDTIRLWIEFFLPLVRISWRFSHTTMREN